MSNLKPQTSKVIVGMSGGVDSSVAAALLLDEGYEVTGAFMKNWSDTKDPVTGECAWRKERDDAMRVAADLGIPFVTFDFEKEYRAAVVDYMTREYAAGRTPNPDVMCNRDVKFDLFLKEALKLGADFIATGHYARKSEMARERRSETGATYKLLAGFDRNKDQSYFVFSLTQDQLKHVLFPIGHLAKRDVRAHAKAKGLHVAEKKDSQGICFIGKVDLKDFLARSLKPVPGEIVTTDGEVIGRHGSVHAFTVGQRHGLGVGGGTPYFVVAKDVATGRVTVAEGAEHPALFRTSLLAGEWHWVSGKAPELPFRCLARHRYRQPLQVCTVQGSDPARGLTPAPDRSLLVTFDVPQRAVTPGQFVVLYDGDEVLGGGVIS